MDSFPLLKGLAANDRPSREKALATLTQFLQTKKTLGQAELLKLHKGLFYTMWFSDRPRTQQKLADELGGLLQVVSVVNFGPFLRAFWSIMAREFESIDRHRVDKFYMLMRRYVYGALKRLLTEEFDEGVVQAYLTIMRELPLNSTNRKVSNGIKLHVMDVYVDEVERLREQDEHFPVETLIQPIKDISADKEALKLLRTRANEVLADGRLVDWGVVEAPKPEIDDGDDGDEWTGFD